MIAGKILITPKGAWSAGDDYEPLDLVVVGEQAYICIKSCRNVPVTDNTHWRLFFDGAFMLAEVNDRLDDLEDRVRALEG